MVLAAVLSVFPLCLFIILKKYFVVWLVTSRSKSIGFYCKRYLPSSAKVAMLLEDCFVPKHCLHNYKWSFSAG